MAGLGVSIMVEMRDRDPDLEWLDHVQPIGLVVAPSVLKELGLSPERQTQLDTSAVSELIEGDNEKPALAHPWEFFERILGWNARNVAGAPNGPPLPDALSIRLPDHDTTLEPTWAVAELTGTNPWQLLVRIEVKGIAPDKRGALVGWEATPHQRFERLLRETGIFAGVLLTDEELRLVYSPRGETSGWFAFPLRPLAAIAGRPMLGGLKLMLGAFQLFNDADDRRLPALLKRSREAQAAVSTALSDQVLGALHELLRGFSAAEPTLISELAETRPARLYEGLLTVLMRLVFILYAEDRDLIPSRSDTEARALYEQGYSVRGLYAKLLEDAALNPDTMEERLGAWGRLLSLFRLVHRGDHAGWIKGRGGKLFDPDVFPFLEGRKTTEEAPRIAKLSDGSMLRLLQGLMTLKGERLSYRALDVEQIGSVYETVMGFTVERTTGPSLAIRAGKNNRTPVFTDLAHLVGLKPDDRIRYLKDEADRGQVPAKQQTAIKQASTVDEVATALDTLVDERASPGKRIAPSGTPILQPTDERRRTGSHYTPRTLTEPIVRYALEPAIERLGPDARPEAVLDLKVCDPAMGSGAFLVEACRALALRLGQAWVRWPETRPTIPVDEDEELHARRLVAQRCLYGVDRNPMATDLAKLSIWLATLARDHEFTFVDHALKSGDSLVGLSQAQIAAATWGDPEGGAPLLTMLVRDRFNEALQSRAAIRNAPDDVVRAIQEQRYRQLEDRLDQVRLLGDAVVAAFFAAEKMKARVAERRKVQVWLSEGNGAAWGRLQELVAPLQQGKHPSHPFHWEIEFPEVFARENPGFDAIIGNPPFAGKNTIIAGHKVGYIEWLQALHPGAHGNADFVAHFFRRAFSLLRRNGVFGLIATNTIGQGDTRETGLARILTDGGSIRRAVRRLQWPGEAAVIVSIVHVAKGEASNCLLDERPVRRISAYLVEGDLDASPASLAANAGKAFQGSIILGMGFTFDHEAAGKGVASSLAEMRRLLEMSPKNAERILPYIGGEELNNDPRHAHRRYVINFDEMSEQEARVGWPDLMAIVERKVKPQRNKDSREARRTRWWRFGDRQPGLYAAISGLSRVLAVNCGATPHLAFAFLPNHMIYANTLDIFAVSELSGLTTLQSRVHEVWARFFASSMKDDLRYTPTDCFETFPLPENFEADPALEAAGIAYYDHRAALMIARNEGLTKTYNRFHDQHEKAADIVRLRELHDDMDRAVLRAYGWEDLAARAKARFLDEATEDDHKYQGRYFWPAEFRDEVLARLLALNAERAAAERAAGLAPRRGSTVVSEDELEDV